jgi:DNA-binding IclR family transcriptional regulator
MLGLFSREKLEWRVGEMSAAIGTAKSTVSRIARTLETEGFLVRATDREGYRLGLRVWELGSLAIGDQAEFPQLALRHLRDLAAKLHQSVQAVILDGADVVYVQQVDAMQSLRTYTPLGARFPAYCTATGKALLAYQAPDKIERALRSLKSYTERTVIKPELLRSELERVRKRGYALNKGEWRADIGGIAAPVYDRTGQVIGAIGVTMPLVQYPKDIASPASEAIVRAAEQLSRELGFVPPGNSGRPPLKVPRSKDRI